MKTEGYTYDGMASVCCNKCHTSHVIAFDGNDDIHPEYAIEEALVEIGWDAQNCICPNCRDPEEVRQEWSEDSLEEEPYDEYADYDILFEEENE